MGSTPDGSVFDTMPYVSYAASDHHPGTHHKVHVRIAAAGSLLTAVASELVAGQMWADSTTRKPGGRRARLCTGGANPTSNSKSRLTVFGMRGRLGCPSTPGGLRTDPLARDAHGWRERPPRPRIGHTQSPGQGAGNLGGVPVHVHDRAPYSPRGVRPRARPGGAGEAGQKGHSGRSGARVGDLAP